MGFTDRIKASQAGGAGFAGSSEGHYEAEVNKGSFNMGSFTAKLNQRWENGWRLDQVFMQDGNTIMVWARREGT